MSRIYNNLFLKTALIFLIVLSFCSCQKTNVGSAEGVYPDGPKGEIKFVGSRVSPVSGSAGTVVSVPVNGLGGKDGQFKAYVGATEAQVLTVANDAITIKVPANASTGNIGITINGASYYGPKFTVNGKVYFDPNFNLDGSQATGSLNGIIPYGSNQFIIYGLLTKYGGKEFTGMATIDIYGNLSDKQVYFGQDNTLRLSPASITTMVPLSTGNFLMGGGFAEATGVVENLNGIARIKTSGDMDSIDTKLYEVPNADAFNHPEQSWVLGSAVNAGIFSGNDFGFGGITRMFESADGQNYIVVGNFQWYNSTYYEGSLYNSLQQDYIQMKQLFSIKTDGSLDSSFNYNYTSKTSYPAANAPILDAVQASDGNIVLIGSFSAFNEVPSNRIVKVNAKTGQRDASFNTGGAGPDGLITRITYNKTTKKYIITGLFQHYNGVPANGVAVLNEDGSINTGFTMRNYTGGTISFVKQLNRGLIIIGGTFTTYDGISRPGFAILNPDGSLAQGYNNTGYCNGFISDVIETTAPGVGQPAVFLVGSFNRFDATAVSNIIKIVIEN